MIIVHVLNSLYPSRMVTVQLLNRYVDAATARSMTEEEMCRDNMLADTVMLREVAASRTTITLLLQTLTCVASNDSVNGYHE